MLDPSPQLPPPRYKILIRVVRPKNVVLYTHDWVGEQATPSGWETLPLLRFMPPGVGGQKGRDIMFNKRWPPHFVDTLREGSPRELAMPLGCFILIKLY